MGLYLGGGLILGSQGWNNADSALVPTPPLALASLRPKGLGAQNGELMGESHSWEKKASHIDAVWKLMLHAHSAEDPSVNVWAVCLQTCRGCESPFSTLSTIIFVI